MHDPEDLRSALGDALERLDIAARPVVIPTPWDIGPVTAYLFPTDPVTLIDAGINTAEARQALRDAFVAEGLEPNDVRRIIVTHAHLDHFGGAVWLQAESNCIVHLHPDDIAIADPSSWRRTNEVLFPPLGFTEEQVAGFWSDEGPHDMRAPAFTAMTDGTVFQTGETRLRVEHHAGHSPGHVWVVDEASGAIFVGDYIIGDHPTNAGMEIDETQPMGRAPLLAQYNAGLRALRDRPAPVLFPAHGPPISDHAALIERRLAKSDRRTRHVLEGVVKHPNSTALEIGRALYGTRPERSWEVVADLVGRLDLLVAEGRVSSRMGEDGAWHFTATTDSGES
jgi:glyoxylase-like metal-dependent hydrolase (beta-lactamase superfamily II)